MKWSAMPANLKVTCSAGIAPFREMDTAETLLARADTALYKSTGAGRNRVSVGQ
jgi:PleD family two-component response regulator